MNGVSGPERGHDRYVHVSCCVETVYDADQQTGISI